MCKSLLLLATLVLIASGSQAQAPDSLSFQGYVTDNLGQPIDSSGWNITFKLYKGGSSVWSETQSVDIVNGVFNVYLGAVEPLDTVAFNGPIDLGITLTGQPEISPRTALAASAYARALPGLYTYFRDGGSKNGYNVVGGSPLNAIGATVVGATVFGGGRLSNLLFPNRVDDDFGTVSGGLNNAADGQRAVVGGGGSNTANGNSSTVGGGSLNTATATYSTVSGGGSNWATGYASTVSGGVGNVASGDATFAAGRLAGAFHDGSFVWQGDTGLQVTDTLKTTAPNQFLARAPGGVTFLTAAAPDLSTGAMLAAGSGTWADLSSVSAKRNFRSIDPIDYLNRLAALELRVWSYRTENGVTHVGPMAEDFHAAFGHGPNDHTITTIDGSGVAMAAIQGLYQLVKELQTENARMREAMERAGIE